METVECPRCQKVLPVSGTTARCELCELEYQVADGMIDEYAPRRSTAAPKPAAAPPPSFVPFAGIVLAVIGLFGAGYFVFLFRPTPATMVYQICATVLFSAVAVGGIVAAVAGGR